MITAARAALEAEARRIRAMLPRELGVLARSARDLPAPRVARCVCCDAVIDVRAGEWRHRSRWRSLTCGRPVVYGARR